MVSNSECDMTLICGLATLGVSPSSEAYLGSDTYPSILSAIITVANLTVVQ